MAESPKEDKTSPCTLVTFSSQDIEALFISNTFKNPTKMSAEVLILLCNISLAE